MQDITKGQSFYDFLRQDQILCHACEIQLKRLNYKIQWKGKPLHILYEYNDFLENMIFQYKEGLDTALQDVFFYHDIKKINVRFRQYTIVLMPSSNEKNHTRGFTPVKAMLSRCKLSVIEPFYKEVDYKQSLQSFANRTNIRNVMHMKPDFMLPDTKLLLVDDVCTSGSTISWAYHLLSKHTYRIETLVLSAHPLFVESCDKKGLKKKKIFSIL